MPRTAALAPGLSRVGAALAQRLPCVARSAPCAAAPVAAQHLASRRSLAELPAQRVARARWTTCRERRRALSSAVGPAAGAAGSHAADAPAAGGAAAAGGFKRSGRILDLKVRCLTAPAGAQGPAARRTAARRSWP
jgi:hypothetical protein